MSYRRDPSRSAAFWTVLIIMLIGIPAIILVTRELDEYADEIQRAAEARYQAIHEVYNQSEEATVR